jgi:hypothetical protein
MGRAVRKAQPGGWRPGEREDAPPRNAPREDAPVLASLGPARGSVDGRFSEAPKAATNRTGGIVPRWKRRFHAMLRMVFDVADAKGTPRADVAASLGVSDRTIDSWLNPGSATVIPGDQLYRLVVHAGHIPMEARRLMLQGLAEDAGLLLISTEAAALDSSPLETQLCEVAASTGRVAEAVKGARADHSQGGRLLTLEERERMLPVALELFREAGELVESLRRGEPGLLELGQGEYTRRIDVVG